MVGVWRFGSVASRFIFLVGLGLSGVVIVALS